MIDAQHSHLLVIDFQARLMPAIHEGAGTLANGARLLRAARLLDVPRIFTEQTPDKLGHTVPELAPGPGEAVLAKKSFDACADTALARTVPAGQHIVVCGCEAHVCVLQSVLGLMSAGREVAVVADATGSRAPANRNAAIARMAHHGAEIVTTEMVLFEWLKSASHPRFREVLALIR
ncbi:MAG: isochorismatase family protein [Roseovarius sp.]|jgi:nicotinamidase-related amidase|nr:isochorismatase family protein [Roseovarius sp.]